MNDFYEEINKSEYDEFIKAVMLTVNERLFEQDAITEDMYNEVKFKMVEL